MDAEAFALRAELERLASHYTDIAHLAQRLIDFGEAWLAKDDFTYTLDSALGSGVQVAVKYSLIDPASVDVVPEAKRQRITAEGIGVRIERLDRETKELLDGDLIGEGNLITAYKTLFDASDVAHRRVEELMRQES